MIGSVTFPSRRSPPTGLPSTILLAGEVEQIVHDLERHADVQAVVPEGVLLLAR
jgi:hypothetical protein